jgi:hypothetical protein
MPAMIRPLSSVWVVVAALFLTTALPTPRGWAQRQRPLTKPGASIPPPYQSPAARGQSSRPTPMPRGDTVPLPFNLIWGDSQQRIASLFGGVGARITERKPSGQGEVWTVQGLIAPGLQASLFTFQQGVLAKVEFDYGDVSWDTAKYNEIMGQLRRRLEGLCGGPGEMVSRKTEQAPDSKIKQSLMGYQWLRGDTLVQLFYFSAEEEGQALTYRTISVHYHYQDPTAVTSMPEGPGPTPPPPLIPGSTLDPGPSVSVPSSNAPTPKSPGDENALPEK